MSAQDIVNAEYITLPLGPYRKYFGEVEANFDLIVHGQPGAGKSYFLLKMGHWLAENLGRVLYVSTEELGAKTLSDKIQETGIGHENLDFVRSLDDKDVDLANYDFLFLDSLTDAGLDMKSYKAMRIKYPHLACILLVQKTKAGDFKGGKDWEHEVEIFGEFRVEEFEKDGQIKEHRILDITKNRYGVMGVQIIG